MNTSLHTDSPELFIVEAEDVFSLSDKDIEKIQKISKPQSYTNEEWSRVRDNFVYNGLSDGIIPHDFPNVSAFVFEKKGPSESPKFSKEYENCTGICAIGISREDTNKRISTLTHQVPFKNTKHQRIFVSELKEVLRNIQSKIDTQTLHVEIFGGRDRLSPDMTDRIYAHLPKPQSDLFRTAICNLISGEHIQNKICSEAKKGNAEYLQPLQEHLHNQYVAMTETLVETIKEECGLEPRITLGPNTQAGCLNAYLDTQESTLYITRPKQK